MDVRVTSIREKKGLSVKDLITIGVLNTVALVCYAVAVILSCTTVIGLFFSTAAAFLVMGPVYMLIACKVRKRGTLFLCGALMSLIGIFGGRIFTTVGCLVGGVLAEIIAGEYKRFFRIAAAYAGYAVAVAAGIYMPGFLIGTSYLLARGKDRGMTVDTVKRYESYFGMKNLLPVLVLNLVAALLGAYIGKAILKKHFIKAGIIEEKHEYKVFPWWKARLYGSILSLRARKQNPERILRDYIQEGMTVADIGCGMGYFTIPMAKMAGINGRIIAVDLQKEMLNGLDKRARRHECESQIIKQNCTDTSLGIEEWNNQLSFVLLFAVAHEVPNRRNLFKEIGDAMQTGAKLLFAEPKGHVSQTCFEESISFAVENGFQIITYPDIAMSRAVLLQKTNIS